MKHLLYRTTNLLNGRFYVGMHSTRNPEDGYLGSGKRLKYELKKYGRENFKKEILELLPTRKALEEREAQIVNEQFLANPLCLNLKKGGEGGQASLSEVSRKKISKTKTGVAVPKLSEAKKRYYKMHKADGDSYAKQWKIKLPTGEVITVLNLAKWCRENKIHFDLVRRTLARGSAVKYGAHKGLQLLQII